MGGKFKQGNTARARLTPEQVNDIKTSLAEGVLQKILAYNYGVARSTIGAIARGATWKNLEETEHECVL